MNKNKGFTLIELLVVIAIIGILASVVLASLSSARDKGRDAAVKSQIAAMKAQGELFYSTNEIYTGVCGATQANNGFGGGQTVGLLPAASSSSGVTNTVQTSSLGAAAPAGSAANTTCHDYPEYWVAEAPLVSGKFYCADSTGVSKEEDAFMALGAQACL